MPASKPARLRRVDTPTPHERPALGGALTPAPAVTIAIPFIDGDPEQFALSVRSVFAQTCDDWELLLVADGPVPRLRPLLDNLEAVDRVAIAHHDHNRGLAARLNEIARTARGEYLMRMDADDACHPQRVSTLLAFMRSQPKVDLVASRAFVIDGQNRVLGLFNGDPLATTHAAYLKSNQLTHPTVMAKSSWFRANPYDESYPRSEDKELWLRAFPDSVFAKLEEPLLYYRISDLSPRKQGQDAAQDRRILRHYGPSLVGRPRTTRALATSYAKQVTFGATMLAGMSGSILRRKYSPLEDTTLDAAQRCLVEIERTGVPGWA